MKPALVALLLALAPATALGQIAQDTAKRQAEGKALGQSGVDAAASATKNSGSVYSIPFYEDRDWGEWEDAEGKLAAGEGAVASDETASWLVDSQTKRPSSPVSASDDWLQRSWDLYRQDHSELVGGIEETYGDCRVEGGPRQVDVTETFQCDRRREPWEQSCAYDRDITVDEDYRYICDEVLDKTTNTCTIGRIVRVDADYLYQCTNTQVIERRTCDDTLTVTVDNSAHCTGLNDSIHVDGFNNFLVTCNPDGKTVTVSTRVQSEEKWTFAIQDAEQIAPFKMRGEVWNRTNTDTQTVPFTMKSMCVVSVFTQKRVCYVTAEYLTKQGQITFDPVPKIEESWSSTCGPLESIAR